MSSKQTPEFSTKLQKVFEKVQPGLNAYQDRLDRLSKDIRSTEAALKDADFNIPVRIEVKNWTELGDDTINDVEMGINGTEWHFTEYLHWTNQDDKGFRLYFEQYRQEGYLETDGIMLIARGTKGQAELIERKLLIDCKASKRLEIEPKLENLLLEVGKIIDPQLKEEADKKHSEDFQKVMDTLWTPANRKKQTQQEIERARADLKATENGAVKFSAQVISGGGSDASN